MVATLLQRFLKQYTIAQIMLVLDGIIVLSGMFFFGVKPALYAVVAIFITTEVSDAIMEGIKYSKAAYIITEDAAEVADALMHRMNRGVTAIHAKGMYSGNEKDILFCAVSKKEIVEKTEKAAEKTDIAVLLFSGEEYQAELEWFHYFKEKHTPTLCVLSKADTLTDSDSIAAQLKEEIKQEILVISSKSKEDIEKFKEELIRLVPDDYGKETITGALVEEGDLVLLVMPQDIQAPKGRLILPQVQTIRDLLDHKCLVMSCTTDKLEDTLAALARPPKLIITDSQVFRTVYDKKPQESLLTSFSVLFAEYKGDFAYYKESAAAISSLTEESKVLIAECCTHAPLKEDIGREKIPNMLRKRIGAGLTVDIVSGTDFPKDLSNYDLIIQCGACMFNKKYVMTRIERAKEQKVPMSNYGVAIAYLSGILDKISY